MFLWPSFQNTGPKCHKINSENPFWIHGLLSLFYLYIYIYPFCFRKFMISVVVQALCKYLPEYNLDSSGSCSTSVWFMIVISISIAIGVKVKHMIKWLQNLFLTHEYAETGAMNKSEWTKVKKVLIWWCTEHLFSYCWILHYR